MVIPQIEIRQAWLSRLEQEEYSFQKVFARACTQWICSILPWGGRDLTFEAKRALEALWGDKARRTEWEILADTIAEQIPNEDEVPNFSAADGVFESAMTALHYTCLIFADRDERALEYLLDCLLEQVWFMYHDTLYPKKLTDDTSLYEPVINGIYENRGNADALTSGAMRWRDRILSECGSSQSGV